MESMTKKYVIYAGYKLRVLAEDEDDFLLYCDVPELDEMAWSFLSDDLEEVEECLISLYVKLENYFGERFIWADKDRCKEVPEVRLGVIYE